MDSVRYFVAVLSAISWPPAILFWYVIHPFAGRWRRFGRRNTYLVVTPAMMLLGYLLWRVRTPLLGTDLGTNPALVAIGVTCYVIAAVIERYVHRHLKFRILAGVPQLGTDRAECVLLTEGIYSRLRHPRYLSVAFGLVSMAFFCNYAGLWILLTALVPALFGLVVIEERELRDWFGPEYDDYARRVPRFVPRMR